MRKLMLLSTGFYIVVVIILFFQAKNAFLEINKSLNIVQEKQVNLETLISKLDLQVNGTITELSNNSDKQNKILNISINGVKNLITSYTEELKNKNISERLVVVNALVESDSLVQQLLGDGALKYRAGNFTEAIQIYKKILDIDASNIEAVCFYNASLYYQNPGDSSIFSGIKTNLIPLLEDQAFTKNQERTALSILEGISMEEGIK